MKNLLIAALMFVSVGAKAAAYLDYIGKKDVPIYKSAGFDITPRDVGQTAGVTNIGLITHDKKNGSLCRILDLGAWCVPESIVPLQASVGGSFSGGLNLGLGGSFNAMPQIASLAMAYVDRGSAGWLQSTKAVLTQDDPTKTNIRLGLDFMGTFSQDGRFQPMKLAYPGRGPLAILEHAARLNVGLAW